MLNDRAVVGTILMALLAAASCTKDRKDGPVEPEAEVVASVAISPDAITMTEGETRQLSATVRSARGLILTDRQLQWRSDDPMVASVDANGLVAGEASGTTRVNVTTEGRSASASVTVVPPPVASVEVSPAVSDIEVSGTVQLTAKLRDSRGRELAGRVVAWASDNTAVALVDGAGLVTGKGEGAATVTATSEGVSGSAAVTVNAPAAQDSLAVFASIAAGNGKTCALTAAGKAYCWGMNAWGDVGDGTTFTRDRPVPVATALTFREVSAGGAAGQHTCALTMTGEAYCWGANNHGQLGDGSTQRRALPGPVAGGLQFSAIGTAREHTCGLAGGVAYCWGQNQSGQLGDGTSIDRNVPNPVAGGSTYFTIAPGGWWAPRDHTCALAPAGGGQGAPAGAAFCWGDNIAGAVGDGSKLHRLSPAPVAGGHVFRQISTGGAHSCAVTIASEAYCWGENAAGQLGDGSTTDRAGPVPVAGNLQFVEVRAGFAHTCGLTPTGEAWCWGLNADGEVGDGTNGNRLTPTPVSGGHVFTDLATGTYHSCGRTPSGHVYCWGWPAAALGSGQPILRSFLPVAVVRPTS